MAKSKFTATRYGNPKKIIEKLSNLSSNVDEAANIALRQTTLKGERIALKHLQAQDLSDFKRYPLSKAYLRQKIKKGLSEKILIATTTYMQSITAFTANGYGFVGVRRGNKEKSGEDVANIALIMEYGSIKRNIKPRRLWKPTLFELKKWIQESGIFVKEIKKKI